MHELERMAHLFHFERGAINLSGKAQRFEEGTAANIFSAVVKQTDGCISMR